MSNDAGIWGSLQGDYVIFTKVTVNGVDKTLLETGCPTLMNFSWDGDSLSVYIPEMQFGNMPFAISFKANCAVTMLNSWEADEHAGGNGSWVKFVGKYGYVSIGDGLKPNGSSITGYFNPITNVIEFVIDYNVMNVRTVCERQELDIKKERVYAEEKSKYEKALADAKRQNGLDLSTPTAPDRNDDSLDDSLDVPTKNYTIIGAVISLEAVKGILMGDIALSTDVSVGGSQVASDVTATYIFSWSGDVMTIKISDLQIGKMPFAINFSSDCNAAELTEEEKADYYSWFKFEGRSGVVSANPENALVSSTTGVSVCYFNPTTMEMVMNIDFNTAGASAVCPRQKIKF